jgi:predicted 2-oxoglutarate/Fe(II)-dependent dioxygenase YbiX
MATDINVPEHLVDYVKLYQFLDAELCKNTVHSIADSDWQKHTYYNYGADQHKTYDDDLSILTKPNPYRTLIQHRLWAPIQQYINELGMTWFMTYNGVSDIRFNKYTIGTNMKLHCDHIQTLFDGQRKGIPTLTLLGLLNDDFQGGQLKLCGETVNLGVGDVVIFPSNFMYPHEVTTVTQGTRYSYVSWVY